MKLLLAAALAASALCAPAARAGAAPAPTSCEQPHAVHVRAGGNLRRAVDAAPPGATICVAAGLYRLSAPVRPRWGQVLIGDRTVLDGSRVLSGFRRVADGWRVTGQRQDGERDGFCVHGTACTYPNDVLSDGRPLHRVLHRDRLAPGRYWSDYPHHAIVVDVDPSAHRLTALVAPAAVVSRGAARGSDVVVRGFTVQHFATPAQHGAIATSAPGWHIDHDTVRDDHGAGITADGHVSIRHDLVDDNGQLGIGGTGRDTRVESTTIRHNGTGGYDPGWEAGGAKWAVTDGLRVTHDRVLDNHGPGLWTDIDAEHTTFRHDVVRGNTVAGIFIEISTTTTVEDDVVDDNGAAEHGWLWGSGIQLAGSHGVTVTGNRLAGNRNGIGLIQQDRGTSGRDGSPRTLHDITVADNVVRMDGGDSGGVTDDGYRRMFTDPSITWRRDTWIGTAHSAFDWNDTYLTLRQWRALGHDRRG